MPATIHRTAQAFVNALQNDAKHVVSSADARKIVDAAVEDVATSNDPRGTFQAAQKHLAAAQLIVSGPSAATKLGAFEARGASALATRLAELGGGGSTTLPADLKAQFSRMLVEQGLAGAGRATVTTFTDAKTSAGTRSFTWSTANGGGTAYARLDGASWIFAPQAFTSGDVTKVKALAKTYFDASFKVDMEQWGASAAEIAAARAAFVPERALFAGEQDPHGLVDSYPLVFQISNESGSDHGVYMGFDTATGANETYSFN